VPEKCFRKRLEDSNLVHYAMVTRTRRRACSNRLKAYTDANRLLTSCAARRLRLLCWTLPLSSGLSRTVAALPSQCFCFLNCMCATLVVLTMADVSMLVTVTVRKVHLPPCMKNDEVFSGYKFYATWSLKKTVAKQSKIITLRHSSARLY